MAISNETVLETEISDQRRPETLAERPQRLEKSLELGLEETIPASDAVGIVHPPRPPVTAGRPLEARRSGR